MSQCNEACTMCADEEGPKCPECKCGCDLIDIKFLGDGDEVECMGCGETYVINGNRLQTEDEAYESRCESQEAARYEDAAYGNDDEEYYSSQGRSPDSGREDFHSDG